jgi:hypothetical protein
MLNLLGHGRHGTDIQLVCRVVGMAWPMARPGTARVGTATRGGTEECRASTARPCRVLCRAGTVSIYNSKSLCENH